MLQVMPNGASACCVLSGIINVHVCIHPSIFVFNKVVVSFHKSASLVSECGNADETYPNPALFMDKKEVFIQKKVVLTKSDHTKLLILVEENQFNISFLQKLCSSRVSGNVAS